MSKCVLESYAHDNKSFHPWMRMYIKSSHFRLNIFRRILMINFETDFSPTAYLNRSIEFWQRALNLIAQFNSLSFWHKFIYQIWIFSAGVFALFHFTEHQCSSLTQRHHSPFLPLSLPLHLNRRSESIRFYNELIVWAGALYYYWLNTRVSCINKWSI